MATVIQVPTQNLETIKDNYRDYLKPQTPQNAIFAAKYQGTTITAYASGKILFQGGNDAQVAQKWQHLQVMSDSTKKSTPNKNKIAESPLPKGFENWSVLGSDEVGTGSYFGALTVVACYVESSQIGWLQELGVQDSKKLTDPQIIELAKQLVQILPYSCLTLAPEQYNKMQQTMNQGQLKAVCHNQALQNVLAKMAPKQPQGILIDQFVQPSTYFKYLKGQKKILRENVYFITKGESHHIAVAAASIIARYAFLLNLDDLTQRAGFSIPSGAGQNVDLIAAHLLKKGGLHELGKYAKLHFANTQKAQKIAGK